MVEKGQRLDVNLPEPLTVAGDRRQLEQVVVNLLVNAHRHTPAGTHIALSSRPRAGAVHLTVHDTGPGIPSGELEGIFARFRRGDAAAGGAGLGLAIAKGIVELHDGRIWAESTPGRGATFHILLPQAPTEDGV